MANWISVDKAEFTTFLRRARAIGSVGTEDIQSGKLRIFYAGDGDYRNSDWLAKKEVVNGMGRYFIVDA